MIHTFHRNFTCILSYSRFPTSVLNIFDWRPTVDKPRGQVNLLFEDVLSCLLARCSFLAPALKINKCYFFQANGFSAVKQVYIFEKKSKQKEKVHLFANREYIVFFFQSILMLHGIYHLLFFLSGHLRLLLQIVSQKC